jgi:hypothetical protein
VLILLESNVHDKLVSKTIKEKWKIFKIIFGLLKIHELYKETTVRFSNVKMPNTKFLDKILQTWSEAGTLLCAAFTTPMSQGNKPLAQLGTKTW